MARAQVAQRLWYTTDDLYRMAGNGVREAMDLLVQFGCHRLQR